MNNITKAISVCFLAHISGDCLAQLPKPETSLLEKPQSGELQKQFMKIREDIARLKGSLALKNSKIVSAKNLADGIPESRSELVFPEDQETTDTISTIQRFMDINGSDAILPLLDAELTANDYRPVELILRSAVNYSSYSAKDVPSLTSIFLFANNLEEPIIVRARNITTPQVCMFRITETISHLIKIDVNTEPFLSAKDKKLWLKNFFLSAQKLTQSSEEAQAIERALVLLN